MNITTKQAAERLGVTVGTITSLGNRGKLARVKIGKGSKRNVYKYLAGSVNEYKRSDEYRKYTLNFSRAHTNGNAKRTAIVKLSAIPQDSVAGGIKTRLNNMEDKVETLVTDIDTIKKEMADIIQSVNHLVKIWS